MNPEDTMREITKAEFFATVGQMDVIPEPQRTGGTWGRSLWKLRRGRVVGVTVMQPGYPVQYRYFVPEKPA